MRRAAAVRGIGAVFWLAVVAASGQAADKLDYSLADPDLTLVRLDSSPTESFLSVRADSTGRLFVGGREALFVYEPDDQGAYQPRRLLYRFPAHTWVNDIAIRGDDLYVLTVSALYMMPGGVSRREGLRVQRLLWGVPRGHVHQCFHALTWGPEGDLYLSMGDPNPGFGDFNRPDHWYHWTFHCGPDGREKLPYNGVGGVFRCRPDGTRLRIVATGLRNPCGLTTDRNWNFFATDNDHESMPAEYVPGRLLHVTPGAAFNWPRGWMPEKQPGRADLLETMFTGMGRAVPVGMAYYDDTYLPARYRHNLLVARWCTRQVTRYPIEPRGASYQASEHVLLQGRDQARPVGVCVGHGGRIFVTIAYMAHNEGSPIYKSDLVMITRRDDSATHAFIGYDPAKASPAKLLAELSSPSWSARYAAHVELLRRRIPVADLAGRLATVTPADPALPHLVWLTGAAAQPQAREPVEKLVGHSDPIVRAHAVRSLAEFFRNRPTRDLLVGALEDKSPHVAHAALTGLFPFPGEPNAAVVHGPARSRDTYLRQAAALLLAERSSTDRLAQLCSDRDALVRLAGVLATGFRLTVPPSTQAVPQGLKLVQERNAEEAYVVQFADAKVDLRKDAPAGQYLAADYWKLVRGGAEQQRLFNVLKDRLGDSEDPVRVQAAYFLSLLNDPRSEPLVAKVHRANDERRLASAPLRSFETVWVAGPFPDGDRGFEALHPPEQGPIDVSSIYHGDGKTIAWKQVTRSRYFDFQSGSGNAPSAFYAYCRLESPRRERAQLLLGTDDGVKVWHNGQKVWTNRVMRGALPIQDTVALDLQPGSNDLLVRLRRGRGECRLYLHYRALGNVVAALPLKERGATLAERLRSASGLDPKQLAEFLKIDWADAVKAGDAGRGRQLFGSLACAKCHAVTNDANVAGGPSLAEAGKRFTVAYLVESVLSPSKQVSPVFRATQVETRQGLALTGLVIAETADKLELLLPDTTRKTFAKADVIERRLLERSPMPEGIVKTPAELRDILRYLLSDKPLPP